MISNRSRSDRSRSRSPSEISRKSFNNNLKDLKARSSSQAYQGAVKKSDSFAPKHSNLQDLASKGQSPTLKNHMDRSQRQEINLRDMKETQDNKALFHQKLKDSNLAGPGNDANRKRTHDNMQSETMRSKSSISPGEKLKEKSSKDRQTLFAGAASGNEPVDLTRESPAFGIVPQNGHNSLFGGKSVTKGSSDQKEGLFKSKPMATSKEDEGEFKKPVSAQAAPSSGQEPKESNQMASHSLFGNDSSGLKQSGASLFGNKA